MVLLLLGMTSMIAQNNSDTNLYRFINQVDSNGSFLVLNHNLSNNNADFQPESNTVNGKYSQSFIIESIPGEKGKVFIISAKKPNYFLKRNGNPENTSSNERAMFDTYEESDDIRLYSWEIILQDSDDPEIVSIQAAGHRQYAVQCQFVGNGRVTFLRNTNGKRLTPISDNEVVANGFRYRLQQITNTF